MCGFALGEAWIISGRNTVIDMIMFTVGISCGFLMYGIYSIKKKHDGCFRKIIIYGMCFVLLEITGMLNVHRKNAISAYAECANEKSGSVSGNIYDIKEYDNYTDIYVKAETIQAEDAAGTLTFCGNTRLTVRVYAVCEYRLGQYISASGTFRLYRENVNPGGFNSKRYYENKGIYLYCDNAEISSASESHNVLTEGLKQLRERLSFICDKAFGEKYSGIMKTMLLGDKTDLDADVKREYRLNGIAHVLAISGLHVSMLGMWVFKRLRKFTGSYAVSGIIAIVLVILYGMMTGLGTATFRAVIMLVFEIAAKIIGRTSDLLTSMGAACVILCMINPMLVRDAGFLLSFGAIFAIGAVSPLLMPSEAKKEIGTVKKTMHGIWEKLAVSISINLVITPLLIYFYYEFSLYGILINLFVIPMMSVILASGIVTGIMGLVISPDFIGMEILAFPAKAVLKIYDFLCDFFGALPFSNVNTGSISIWLILIYYVMLAVILYVIFCIRNSYTKKYQLFFMAAAALITFVILSLHELKPEFRIVFLSVGQGDGILITTEEGTNILIDGGSTDKKTVGEYVISPAVKYYGMSDIDYVFLTHGDEDHISGIRYLLEAENTGITIDNLVVAKAGDIEGLSDIISLAEEKRVNIIYMDKGDKFLENGLMLTCLYPAENETPVSENADGELSSNDLSLVLRLEYGGLSVLFTGDIGDGVEEYMTESLLDVGCDILKVAHHGSKYSSSVDFLEVCSPDYAVISCGKNNIYGHPGAETIERLGDVGADIYRTDLDGAVCVSLQKGKFFISSYSGED